MVAIAIAAVIVVGLSVGINKSGLLTADILQGNGTTSALYGADVSYTIWSGSLSVYSEKVFQDAQSLTFTILYDPEVVALESKQIQTPYDFTSSSGKSGSLQITLFVSTGIDANSLLLALPFSWSAEDITISDAAMLFSGGSIDGLAIKKQ